jgi:hypothetical protein
MTKKSTPGDDWVIDSLREQVASAGCNAFVPGTEEYLRATSIWNGAVKHRPVLVIPCKTVRDIQVGLSAARRNGVPVSVKGEGMTGVAAAFAIPVWSLIFPTCRRFP